MAIQLPTLPRTTTNYKFISNFLDLKPSFGGKVQRISRLGDRFGVEVQARPMPYHQGVGLVAALNQGLTQKVLWPVPQPMNVGNPGAPRVASAGQAGTTLTINGLTSGYQFQAGQFISIVHGGVRYLHQITAATAATGTTATVPIIPMLRVSPSANAVVEVLTPQIEGFLQGNQGQWTVDQCAAVGLSFSIEEAQ